MATTLTPSEMGVVPPPTRPERQPSTKRYLTLDAFRGFIMLILAAEGFRENLAAERLYKKQLGRDYRSLSYDDPTPSSG
jgi:hypothetical protein